jgi:acetoin utilization protein AcuB
MFVGQRMTKHPVVCGPEMPVDDALNFMRHEKIRRLPVVDDDRNLLGIVSEKDLLYVSPSPASTLSVFEMHYLLSKIKVRDVMTAKVITVTEDSLLEDAARIMVDNKIGGLPVLRNGKLVGIITETDIFKIFLELLGTRELGCRVSALVPEGRGVLAQLTAGISAKGGDIVSLGTFLGEDASNRMIVFRVRGIDMEDVKVALEAVGAKESDITMIC